MMPTSFTDSTLVVDEIGCPGGGARGVLGQSNRFHVGAAGQADRLEFWSNATLRGGCQYRVTLKRCEFTNIFLLPPSSTTCTTDLVIDYTAETDAPTLVSVAPADSASGVLADALVVATFSEAMAPGSSFALSDAGGPIAGEIAVTGAQVTFTPATPLSGGSTYTVTLGSALTDLAGNAYAGSSTTFSVESTPPQVLSITIPALDRIAIAFDEKMDAASIEPDTASLAGTLHVVDVASSQTVYGCLELDATGATAVFAPLAPLASGAEYQVTVTTGVMDLGGTPLASQVQQTVAAP